MSGDFHAFFRAHGEWSTATFGSTAERGPIGPLKHLAKEVQEAIEQPDDIMEFADLVLLLCDSARRAGFTSEQLMDAAWTKLDICKGRVWPKRGPDEPVEHVEEDKE